MKYFYFLFIALITIFANGCDKPQGGISNLEDKSCFPNPEYQRLFSSALDKSNIKYRSEGDGCFYTKYKDQEKVRIIRAAEFGNQPPAGLSISRGKQGNARVVELLNKYDIKTSKVVFFGTEYVAWSENDADQVESLLDLAPEQLELMRKLRK